MRYVDEKWHLVIVAKIMCEFDEMQQIRSIQAFLPVLLHRALQMRFNSKHLISGHPESLN